ncbi:MAG: hypothetical protein WBQ14_00875 [Gaiellaceae bacterium]
MPVLPKSPAKEERYWASEFPLVLLLITGSFVIAFGLPHLISRSTNWATLGIGAGEVLVATAAFFMARLNTIRVLAMSVFAAGAIAFYMGLSAVY